MQTLHVQQRCVPPPFDISSRVDVGILIVPAIDAPEDRLAFATSCIDYAAAEQVCDVKRAGTLWR